MKPILTLALGLCATTLAFGQAATIAVGTPLTIFENQKVVVVQTAKGPIEITRTMTPCGKNGGTIQPLVPVAGDLFDVALVVLAVGDEDDRPHAVEVERGHGVVLDRTRA